MSGKVKIHSIPMDDPPRKKVDVNGLTSENKQDIDITFGGNEPQKIVFMNIPYYDHNGEEKFVVAAVYNVVRQILPPRLPTLLPPLSPPPYEISDILGKGKGIIATRDIALGEIVIVERPVLICAHTMKMEDIASLAHYVRLTMDRDVWNSYHDLANAKDTHIISTFFGVLETNAFEIDLIKGKEKYNGVFLESSRLNHSCGPNLARSWDPYLFTLSVQAVRPIRAGQELTIAYENPCGQSHADRRYNLERNYGFKCTCGYCTEPMMSDEVRPFEKGCPVSTFFEYSFGELLEPDLPRHMGHEYAKMLLNGISKSLVLVTMEGIECVSAFWHYLYLMKVSGILGDKKGLKKWGFKAVLLSVRYMHEQGGQVRHEVGHWIDWVRVPERFPGWALFR